MEWWRLHWRYGMGLAFTSFTLLLMIIAASVPWYKYTYKVRTVRYYMLEHLAYFEEQLKDGKKTYSFKCSYMDEDCAEGAFKEMYNTILAFVILVCIFGGVAVGILFLFAFLQFQKYSWRRYLRIPLYVLVGFFWFFILFSWLLYFWHPSALKDLMQRNAKDSGGESSSINCNEDAPWCSFVGSLDGFSWGPHAGWALTLISSVFGFIGLLFTVLGGPPDAEGYMALPGSSAIAFDL